MIEPLQQRMTERQIYETVVNLIVDTVNLEFPKDVEARLRVYDLVAENFRGMVKVLRVPEQHLMLEEIEHGVA